MAFLAAAAPIFPELIMSAEEGLGAMVSGFTTEFIKEKKKSIAKTIGADIYDITKKNPSGLTNLTLNEVIKKKNYKISHPKKVGRKHKRI